MPFHHIADKGLRALALRETPLAGRRTVYTAPWRTCCNAKRDDALHGGYLFGVVLLACNRHTGDTHRLGTMSLE